MASGSGTNTVQPKPGSQCDLMLRHLREGKAFTSLEALHLFGSIQPAARIWELKNDYGISGIVTEMVHDERTGKKYARYSLVGGLEQ